MRRGILGGTFDPPHIAHLIAGETAYRELELDVVTFMPAGAPWQKAGRKVSDPADRWQMIVLATGGTSYFEADDREVRRDGWTYTIDTLGEFDDDEDLFLVVGADAALGLPTWHRGDEVMARTTIVVIPRPGTDREAVEQVVPDHVWLDMPEMDISGTMLRDRAQGGRSIRFYVPDLVYDYVVASELYG